MTKVKRALVSVSDKKYLVQFCKFLKDMDVEIISTGGTAKALNENGISTTSISDVTGFPEMMDGRVKTLHPKVHGGLLGLRDNPEHVKTMEEHGIKPIDLVVVNLYPFEKVSNNPKSSFEETIENIDIGGPSMVRSAAKNFRFVGIVTDPSQYKKVMKDLNDNNGELSLDLKKELAHAAFALTSHYDNIIASFLKYGKPDKKKLPGKLSLKAEKFIDLRYGENPHQEAAFYKTTNEITEPCLPLAMQIQGKELSFNNILDFDSAISCLKEFSETACVIVKHTNPCGIASGNSALNAFERAWACDPVSAFGSIIATNEEIDAAAAKAIVEYFVEGVIAPDISPEAKEIFSAKKNIRVMILTSLQKWKEGNRSDFVSDNIDFKKVVGGILLQERDLKTEDPGTFEVVTQKAPDPEELKDLCFAWKAAKHIKSNAIVFVKNRATVGIGAGQMSRVDSTKIGIDKSKISLLGAVMASDAFFPFRDSIDLAAKAGISAIVQPGGSIKDQEVIAACNEHKIAMVFTHTRHFKH